MGGFAYRGKNIGDFGEVYYIPDADERGDYALPYKVEEQEINGRDGGYYYGNHVEPREFVLRCYYENLTRQTKEDMLIWFRRDTKGKLVFDDRDWVYYNVIPNERVTLEDHMQIACDGSIRYQGIMTIRLKAYDPFGRLMPDACVNDVPVVGTAIVGVSIAAEVTTKADDETIILLKAMMPSPNYPLNQSSFYVYNPGTERTPLTIRIAGTASDGLITNITNGTKCAVKGMTNGNTTDVGKSVVINAETGRVTLLGSLDEQLAFDMHDYGYIWLDPCVPFLRDAEVSYTNGSKTVTSSGLFTEEMAGRFIYLNGEWRKIETVESADSMTLTANMNANGSETTQIVTMNEIRFDGFTLTTLEMEYTPRMR